MYIILLFSCFVDTAGLRKGKLEGKRGHKILWEEGFKLGLEE